MWIENILSGFAGALLGVIFSVYLFRFDRYITAKLTLMSRLNVLFEYVFWADLSLDVNVTWEASIRELRNCYDTVLYFAPFFRRRSLRKAWEDYKGESRDVIEHQEAEGMMVDSKRRPTDRKEFVHRIRSFHKTLQG